MSPTTSRRAEGDASNGAGMGRLAPHHDRMCAALVRVARHEREANCVVL